MSTDTALDEARWTPWGAGWTAPDGKSPEHAFTDFVEAWVALQRPAVAVETGAGSGRVTLRIARALPAGAELLAYESEPEWRERARARIKGARSSIDATARVRGAATPPVEVLARAELAVLDSRTGLRTAELAAWAEHGPDGAYAIVHDVSHRHDLEDVGTGIHGELARHVDDAVARHGLEVLDLPNPRGGRILRRPGGHR